jgi:putative oxidoreductase
MVNRARVLLWSCAIVLALAIVFAGVTKLEGPSAIRWADRFTQWGYPAGTSAVVGVLEILGGLGVLIPRWRRPAAMLLAALMLGAVCTHALHAEFSRVLPPLVLGGLALLVSRAGTPLVRRDPARR